MEWKRIRVLNGYTAKARYYNDQKLRYSAGYISRFDCEHIGTPYFSSPSIGVATIKSGLRVIIMETKHRRFEVFCVPNSVKIFKFQREADDAFTMEYKKRKSAA